jgi:AcrR family transcriptional regulator
VGRREKNKVDKKSRIISAARDNFATHGFKKTTMRNVATEAGVGTGTLFLYAKSKGDLLAKVFMADIATALEKAFAELQQGTIIDRLMLTFNVVIEHHRAFPNLGRAFLQELGFVNAPNRTESHKFEMMWVSNIADVILQARKRGEIIDDVDCSLVAQIAMDVFLAEMYRWSQEWIDLDGIKTRMPIILNQILRF